MPRQLQRVQKRPGIVRQQLTNGTARLVFLDSTFFFIYLDVSRPARKKRINTHSPTFGLSYFVRASRSKLRTYAPQKIQPYSRTYTVQVPSITSYFRGCIKRRPTLSLSLCLSLRKLVYGINIKSSTGHCSCHTHHAVTFSSAVGSIQLYTADS